MTERRFKYSCSGCNKCYFGTLDEIREQVDCTIESPLSPGLVYRPTRVPVYEVVTDQWKIDPTLERERKNHWLSVLVLRYDLQDRKFTELPIFKGSKAIRGNLRSGRARILSFEEFLKFQDEVERIMADGNGSQNTKYLSSLQLLRTDSEVEFLTRRK